MATSYKLLGEGNYIDASGVAYNKTPLDEYLDNLKITTYAKRYDEVYTTTSANQTNIPISLSVFNESTPLFIGINGLIFSEGIDYTIDYTNKRITLTKPIEIAGTKIQIVVLKQVSGTEQTFELLKGEKGEPGDGLPKITTNEIRIWDLEPGIYELAGNTPVLYYNGATGTETENRLIKGSILTVYYQSAQGFADLVPTKSWYSWFNGAAGHGAEHIIYGCTSETSGEVSICNLAQAAKNPTVTLNDFGIFYWDGQAVGSSDTYELSRWQKLVDTARNQLVMVIANHMSSLGKAIFLINPKDITEGEVNIQIKSLPIALETSVWEDTGVQHSFKAPQFILHLNNYAVTSVGRLLIQSYYMESFLPTDSTGVTSYTPTYDYHPATKKYADEAMQNNANVLKIGTNQTVYSNYFTYATNGTYGFDYDNSTGYFENNNKGQSTTTAETNITLTSAIESGDLIIHYEVGSESDYDKFTLTIGDQIVVNEISGVQKGSYICSALANGTIIKLKYYKDNSNDNNGDYARVKLQRTSHIANNAVASGNFITKAQLDSAIGNINQALAKLTDL